MLLESKKKCTTLIMVTALTLKTPTLVNKLFKFLTYTNMIEKQQQLLQ